jgi:hypothetical protein
MTGSYVLITPARDEEEFVAGTIESILAQVQPPVKWVIVNDGSADGTEAIVSRYAAEHDFITLLRRPAAEARGFASKVAAFRQGYREVAQLPFDFVGNLDADVTLEPQYYRRALQRFAEQPRLGICSAAYWNRIGGGLQPSRTRSTDTPGAAQLFRRQCYEEIGGYRPLVRGGEDTVAAAMARMRGWTTQSFAEPKAIHNRPLGGSRGRGLLRYRFEQGVCNYDWGAHPLFVAGKALSCIDESPPVLGSLAFFGGYLSRWLRREPQQVADDVVRFIRREQMRRLGSALRPPRRGGRGAD